MPTVVRDIFHVVMTKLKYTEKDMLQDTIGPSLTIYFHL